MGHCTCIASSVIVLLLSAPIVECSPETKTPIDFCKKRSKTIEVIYKNDEGESIHTSVSFPYHPDVSVQELVVPHV